MTNYTDLHIMAEMLKVQLTHHTDGPPGAWFPHTRTISTRRGMSSRQYRSTLAHELGHATYNDTPQPNMHFTQRQEDRANRFAANLLITVDAFRDAHAWCNGNPKAIAEELEVNEHLVYIWARHNAA